MKRNKSFLSEKLSSVDGILRRAEMLKNWKISDLVGGEIIEKGKGAIGNIIEREGFGIANNNDANPDFKKFGIELKVLPLKTNSKGGLTTKERTKICSINYRELILEKWRTSHAKLKLNKILFVFYFYDKLNPANSEIKDCFLFQLENSNEPLIREDWERTKKYVFEGKAHLLSESQNQILAASRSGAGKVPEAQWPDQPNTSLQKKAQQRAFSLKPSFTKTLWFEIQNQESLISIYDKYEYLNFEGLKKIILDKLNAWEGKSLFDFARFNKIEPKESKNSNAAILRAALGITDSKKKLKEIDQLGFTVKTIPIRFDDNMPFESMSFPHQPLGDILLERRFDNSEFYTYLQGFIFIPLYRNSRSEKDLKKIIIGRSFIWVPTKSDLMKIQKEWELYYRIIKSGIKLQKLPFKNRRGFIFINNLPKESGTYFIHMRPHARDSDDIDESTGVKITKQCFWFNKRLIQRLINENSSTGSAPRYLKT